MNIALVEHLGTMVGGHYVAYVLVDPEKMFDGNTPVQANKSVATDGMSALSLDNANGTRHAETSTSSPNDSKTSLPTSNTSAKRDRRVWCFCSE